MENSVGQAVSWANPYRPATYEWYVSDASKAGGSCSYSTSIADRPVPFSADCQRKRSERVTIALFSRLLDAGSQASEPCQSLPSCKCGSSVPHRMAGSSVKVRVRDFQCSSNLQFYSWAITAHASKWEFYRTRNRLLSIFHRVEWGFSQSPSATTGERLRTARRWPRSKPG